MQIPHFTGCISKKKNLIKAGRYYLPAVSCLNLVNRKLEKNRNKSSVVFTLNGNKKGWSRSWMMARTKQRQLHHYSILATDVCLFCTKYKEVEEPGWRLTEWQLLSHLPEDQRSHLLRSKTGSRYMNSSRNVKLGNNKIKYFSVSDRKITLTGSCRQSEADTEDVSPISSKWLSFASLTF